LPPSTNTHTQVNYVTAEFKNPARDLPRVIHTSLPLVILCYILANVSYFLVLPTHVIESSNTVAVAFGSQVFGPIGALILALFVSGSCFGALNATTFTSGRLVYAAGKEGYMPGIFGTIGLGKAHRAIRLNAANTGSSKVPKKMVTWFADPDAGFFFTPISAMLLNAALTSVYILIGSFDTLVTFYGVAGYTFYFQTVLGLIILRVREPDLERPYKTWITTPIIFCCVSLFLLSRAVFAEPVQTLLVVAFMAVGLVIWFAWVGRRRSKAHQRFRNMEGGSEKEVGWMFWKRWTG
jgi:amino acid transporter